MNRIKDYGKLADSIVQWIKSYTTENNIKSLVVGVSGGIDSAVVSTLCAMTGITTWTAILPIQSSEEHIRLAKEHVFNHLNGYFNVGCEVTDLTESFNAMYLVTTGTFSNAHAWANTKSRLRMTFLYQMAGAQQGVVVGTGNKIEDFGIGFFTKHGDGGVDISPIADLYKTEVRELGRYLGVSQEILDASPTDGLWGEQQRTDEECIGATYEELEWVMENYNSKAYIDSCTLDHLTDRERKVIDIYHKLHEQNRHKMIPTPTYKLEL